MKTLADTKAKILEGFDRKFVCEDDWDHELYQKKPVGWVGVNGDVKAFLSTAIDQAWDDFKGIVKMNKLVCGKCGNASFIWNYDSPDCESCGKMGPEYNVIGYNQAIDELQKRIKEYEK